MIQTHRTHIPIITNENVEFQVGGEPLNLKVGEVWEINNARVHAVYNKSNQKRLHMIIDYYPKNGVINDQSKISINHNLENKALL